MKHQIIPAGNDRFDLVVRTYGKAPETVLASGKSVEAAMAAAQLICPGDWELATCITPNGRTDCHGKYIQGTPSGPACSFCHKPVLREVAPI